ncbi:MAG: hypothetical protein ACJAXM_000859 [Arenicella sp.]|jgi:hypothetical protein
MKNFNTFKKASPLLLLSAMAPAMATDVNVPLNFTTLPVISITEIRPLDFGAVLSLTAADTCTMDTSAGTALTSAQEGVDSTIADMGTVAQVSVGELSGNCAGGADGNVGIYEITSFQDADITISVTTGTTTDIAFTPIGFVTNIIEGGTFTREDLFVGTDALVNASAALTAFAVAGTNRAIVGGTITNQVGLAAGAPYATDFNLNVVYQ